MGDGPNSGRIVGAELGAEPDGQFLFYLKKTNINVELYAKLTTIHEWV